MYMINYNHSIYIVGLDIDESKVFHVYFEGVTDTPPPFIHTNIDTIICIYLLSIAGT